MIVVAATTVSWKCNGTETCWLESAEGLGANSPEEIRFFASLEVDARGTEPFTNLLERLTGLGGEFWTFNLEDGVDEIDSNTRLPRICMGRNVIIDYALRSGASHILFLDTDLRIPGDSISKLLALDWPMVAGDMPNYMYQEKADAPPLLGYDFPVAEHWSPAGYLLVAREVFRKVRWRVDVEAGMTDDPCFAQDVAALGFPTRVRKDIWAEHVDMLIRVEDRADDRKVRHLNL